MTKEEQESVLSLREKLKIALKKKYNAEGFNYAWNEGEVAGQSVPHFHLHIIPRKTGDTGITEYDPRQFLYRPKKWEEESEQILRKIAQDLRES